MMFEHQDLNSKTYLNETKFHKTIIIISFYLIYIRCVLVLIFPGTGTYICTVLLDTSDYN
jgi:hypothetical protein